MEKEKKGLRILIMAVALGQLALVLAFSIYGTVTHKITGRQGDILTAVSLFLFWALSDIAEPFAMHRFDHISAKQKSAYLKYLVFDFVGLAGIAYFIYGMGNPQGQSIIGAVVYVLSVRFKRENQDIFYGNQTDEAEDEADETKPEESQE